MLSWFQRWRTRHHPPEPAPVDPSPAALTDTHEKLRAALDVPKPPAKLTRAHSLQGEPFPGLRLHAWVQLLNTFATFIESGQAIPKDLLVFHHQPFDATEFFLDHNDCYTNEADQWQRWLDAVSKYSVSLTALGPASSGAQAYNRRATLKVSAYIIRLLNT